MTKIINGVASEFEFPADTGVFTQNVSEKENQELKQKYLNAVADYETTMAENNLLKKQLKKYNNIKEMFEIGVVDLEELKNIFLGDDK